MRDMTGMRRGSDTHRGRGRPVPKRWLDDQFRQIAETRKAQVKEWKAIPESKRPTWEQFKRGLKVKKVTFKG